MGSDKRIGRGVLNIIVYLIQLYVFVFIAVTALFSAVGVLSAGPIQIILSIVSIVHLTALYSVVIAIIALLLNFDPKVMILVWRGERKFLSELAEFYWDAVEVLEVFLFSEEEE